MTDPPRDFGYATAVPPSEKTGKASSKETSKAASEQPKKAASKAVSRKPRVDPLRDDAWDVFCAFDAEDLTPGVQIEFIEACLETAEARGHPTGVESMLPHCAHASGVPVEELRATLAARSVEINGATVGLSWPGRRGRVGAARAGCSTAGSRRWRRRTGRRRG